MPCIGQGDLEEDYGRGAEGKRVVSGISCGGGPGPGLVVNLVKAFCATGHYEDSESEIQYLDHSLHFYFIDVFTCLFENVLIIEGPGHNSLMLNLGRFLFLVRFA